MLGTSTMIKLFSVFLSFLVVAANYDTFNYDETDWSTRSFGPDDWDEVQCHDVETCVSSVHLFAREAPWISC